MAGSIEIVRDSDHEDMGLHYLAIEAARLNRVLELAGVESEAKRKQICGAYLFSAAEFLDTGTIQAGDLRVAPRLHFSEPPGAAPDAPTRLHVGEGETYWHESAFNIVGDIFSGDFVPEGDWNEPE